MFRTKPKLKYCGLTIMLSNPSRFDTVSLLSSTGGHVLNDHCLRPDYNVMQCDVRLVQDPTPLLPDTKCVLLLGEGALHFALPQTKGNTLNELRGSPFVKDGIVYIASFFPQDAADPKNDEAKYWKRVTPEEYEDNNPDEDEASDEDEKSHSNTSWSNYAFWLRMDTIKAKRILKNQGKIPLCPREELHPIYRLYPPLDEVIPVLLSHKDELMFFDIETDYEEANIQCFSFSFDGIWIYCVPVLSYDYAPAYTNCHMLVRALALAIYNNILVAHNGGGFDFLVWCFKYHLPVRRVKDTMTMQQRIYPEIEKSLGHGTSLWTWQSFHKDEDARGYWNHDQLKKRLSYCGKDVRTMYLNYHAMMEHAAKIPGMINSIETANDAIVPYLTTTLLGMRCLPERIMEEARESDLLMNQYNRLIKLLIGEKSMAHIRSTITKPKMFAGSNSQCCTYFHDMLGYRVLWRSPKTGKPSLGKKIMYKLALMYPDNPVIQLVLAFRKLQKEYGTYKFLPWKDDEGNQATEHVITLYGNPKYIKPVSNNLPREKRDNPSSPHTAFIRSISS